MEVAYDLLQPKTTQLARVGRNILKKIISQKHPALEALINLGDMGCVIDKIIGLTERFHHNFNKKIGFLGHQTKRSRSDLNIKDHSEIREHLAEEINE